MDTKLIGDIVKIAASVVTIVTVVVKFMWDLQIKKKKHRFIEASGMRKTAAPSRAETPVASHRPLPEDIQATKGASFPLLAGLALGSKKAQEMQKTALREQRLPLKIKSCKTSIVLRYIPAGAFVMGSPTAEQKQYNDETEHPVTLSRGFYMGIYPVTNRQWRSVLGTDPSRFKQAGPDAPVESISWQDAQWFLDTLCEQEGVEKGIYRLPTEAEWEYACRAGVQSPLYIGHLTVKGLRNGPELDAIAWYGGNAKVDYAEAYNAEGWQETQLPFDKAGAQPVGRKKPNAWGLHDMLGNVWEWCADWYGPYPKVGMVDPRGPETGFARVLRGGSWNDSPCCCRCAARDWNTPETAWDDMGLRVVRDLSNLTG